MVVSTCATMLFVFPVFVSSVPPLPSPAPRFPEAGNWGGGEIGFSGHGDEVIGKGSEVEWGQAGAVQQGERRGEERRGQGLRIGALPAVLWGRGDACQAVSLWPLPPLRLVEIRAGATVEGAQDTLVLAGLLDAWHLSRRRSMRRICGGCQAEGWLAGWLADWLAYWLACLLLPMAQRTRSIAEAQDRARLGRGCGGMYLYACGRARRARQDQIWRPCNAMACHARPWQA